MTEDVDIRTDIPRYRIWKHGELAAEVSDIRDYWRDDLVSFVLGCSFSFEHALIEGGIELRHVSQGKNVAMYRTNIQTVPAGPFHGLMVVSMRVCFEQNGPLVTVVSYTGLSLAEQENFCETLIEDRKSVV